MLLLSFCIANSAFSADENASPQGLDQDQVQEDIQPPKPSPDNPPAGEQPPPAVKPSQKKELPEEVYNKGLEMHLKKDEENAKALYQKAVNMTEDSKVRSKSFQNLGVIVHQKARNMIQGKQLDEAEKELNLAEELYRQSMGSEKNTRDVAMNQQKLLNDRKMIEEIRKQQQKLQDKKNEAQKKTQEAMDKNKEAQQDQNKDNKQDKQDQQSKQDQQKDQQQQDKDKKDQQQQQQKDKSDKSEQEQAKDKTKEAQQAVDDYKKEAEKQQAEQDKQAAQKAQEELKKAEEKQDKGQNDKAEENLKKALEALQGGKDKQDKDKDKDKEKGKGKDEKEKKEEKPKEKSEDKPLEPLPEKKDDGEIDPNQAQALLDLMEKDEKSLREAINEQNKMNSRIKEVDKDWWWTDIDISEELGFDHYEYQ